MPDMSSLTLEQLQQRLEELAFQWNEIEAEIEKRTKEAKLQLAEEVQQKIIESGYTPDEIVAILKRRSNRVRSTPLITWVDPDDSSNTYTRGPLPEWLRTKMTQAGVDVTNKEQREAFKKKRLNKIIGN